MTGRESTEPLDPARLAEIRAAVATHHYDDPEVAELLAEVDRLAEALAVERERVQRVEALADQEDEAVVNGSRLYNGALPLALVSVPSLRAALAGDTEGKP